MRSKTTLTWVLDKGKLMQSLFTPIYEAKNTKCTGQHYRWAHTLSDLVSVGRASAVALSHSFDISLSLQPYSLIYIDLVV